MECALNASPNEVALILDAIRDVRQDVADVKSDVSILKTNVTKMDERINGRIKKNSAETERAHKRIDVVMFLPRWFDKLAQHKVLGLVVSIPLTVGLTLIATHLFT